MLTSMELSINLNKFFIFVDFQVAAEQWPLPARELLARVHVEDVAEEAWTGPLLAPAPPALRGRQHGPV